VVIRDYERGVRRRKGRFAGELGAGRHWKLLPSTTIDVVDMRTSMLAVNGQEIPTSDRASVKISALARYRIASPRMWLEGSTNALTELYATLQIALRAAVAKLDLETVLTDHSKVDAEALAAMSAVGERLGLEVESVALKDVAAAGDLKRALADEVKARAEGRAKLERARAETAALRNLINASRLVRENVGLYELRLLETAALAAERPGNSLALGLTKDMLDWQGKKAS
jgi:regulator of protease activity HflC (stomatin/prohibitin superfamily)